MLTIVIAGIVLVYSLGAVYGEIIEDEEALPEPNPQSVAAEAGRPEDDGPDPQTREETDDTSSAEDLPGSEETVRITADGLHVVTNPDHILVLVNKERNLPADYIPDDLIAPDIPFAFEGDHPKKLMREEAAEALQQLFSRAWDDALEIYGLSGYRSYETQRHIFAYNVEQRGEEEANRFSARPGQSEHQTGLAMDVTSPGVGFTLTQAFGETPEGRWLEEHAHEFGFIIRYPEDSEHITGYQYEPWHLRYVGIEHATAIREAGLTLEEYLERK